MGFMRTSQQQCEVNAAVEVDSNVIEVTFHYGSDYGGEFVRAESPTGEFSSKYYYA